MALKDLTSLHDLIGGNQPVGNMEDQQGAQSFDLGVDSMLQENSLPNIPNGSPYQDLNGIDGGNGFFHGIPNPGTGQGKQLGGQDLHVSLLQNQPYGYSYGTTTETNQPGQAGPYTIPHIDLNGGLPSTGKYEDNGPLDGFY